MGAGHGGLELQPFLDAEDGRMVMGRLGDALFGHPRQQAVAVEGGFRQGL